MLIFCLSERKRCDRCFCYYCHLAAIDVSASNRLLFKLRLSNDSKATVTQIWSTVWLKTLKDETQLLKLSLIEIFFFSSDQWRRWVDLQTSALHRLTEWFQFLISVPFDPSSFFNVRVVLKIKVFAIWNVNRLNSQYQYDICIWVCWEIVLYIPFGFGCWKSKQKHSFDVSRFICVHLCMNQINSQFFFLSYWNKSRWKKQVFHMRHANKLSI